MGADTSGIGIDRRLWLVPVVGILASLVVLLGLLLFLLDPTGSVSSIGVTLGGLAGLLVQGCILASGATYYREAKQLEGAVAGWVPTWWAYTLGTLLLGPLVMTVYLIRRVKYTAVSVDFG